MEIERRENDHQIQSVEIISMHMHMRAATSSSLEWSIRCVKGGAGGVVSIRKKGPLGKARSPISDHYDRNGSDLIRLRPVRIPV